MEGQVELIVGEFGGKHFENKMIRTRNNPAKQS